MPDPTDTAAQQECPEGGNHVPMSDETCGVSCRYCRTPMPTTTAATDWTGHPVTGRELAALRAMLDRPASPGEGVGCFYCSKHPQATTWVHDQRGCLPVCHKHYLWRMTQSVISGHSEGCPEVRDGT